MVQTLTQGWWHPVASSEDRAVLHWEMCPASYRHIIAMVIKTASNFPVFFVIVDSVVTNNHSLKTKLWL